MTRAILLLLSLLMLPLAGVAGEVFKNSEQQGVRANQNRNNVRQLRHRSGNRGLLQARGERRGTNSRRRRMEDEGEDDDDEDAFQEDYDLESVYNLSHDGTNDVRRRKKKGGSDSREADKIQRSLAGEEGEQESSIDETFLQGEYFDSIDVPDTGADTSLCPNAISIDVGSTVKAEVTHTLDQSSVEDCDGGYELNNPFVEVMGMWFAVEGTGGVLRASSCPALISVYQGEDCDSSSCAESASHLGVPCHVEWQSAPGQVDYILVTMIELSFEEDSGFEVPVQLSIVETSEEAVGEAMDTPEEAVGAELVENTSSAETDSPTKLPPDFDSQTLRRCNKATQVVVGETMDVDLTAGNPTVGYCGDLTELDDVEVEVSEAWFALEGDGRVVRARSCPARVTILSGQDCNDLVCTTLVQHQFGCEVEWRTETGRNDFILVQSLDFVSGDESFVGPTSLSLEALDDEVEENEAIDEEAEEENESETSGAATPSDFSDQPVPSHLDRCQNAELVSPGQEVRTNAVEISGVAAECSHTFTLEGFEAPVLGAWFSVAGTGGTLKASACPARVTVFAGTCDSLTCVDSETNEFGCELEWQSSEDGQIDYILVQTIGFGGEDGFVLPVTLSISDPNVQPTDVLRDPPQNAEGEGTTIAGVEDNEDGKEEEEDTGTAFVFIDPVEEGCMKADAINSKESAYVPFDLPIENLAECKEISGDSDLPIFGSWFTVGSQTKKTLRASACPGAQISVYEGECGDLKCVGTREVGDSGGCEVEWKPSRRGTQQHILVHRPTSVDGSSRNEPVVLFMEEA